MQNTTNYNLKKPEMTDASLITDINDNMDAIDEELKSINDKRGLLSSLLTTVKTSIVAAINELTTDYIIEQGTSGDWTYRKWKSGFAECFTTETQVHTFTSTTAWGVLYESPKTYYTYPSGLFTDTPICFANKVGGAGGWLEVGGSATKDRTPDLYVLYPVNKTSSTSAGIGIYAFGKWK